jgi:hypothetical protein
MNSRYKHPLFKRWKNMLDNTTNPNCHGYKLQGALGIKVDKSFWNFWKFVDYVETNLGLPHHPRTCLVRKDKDKNWAPGNLIWATVQENSFRRRDRTIVTYKRQKKSLAEWCVILDLPYMRTFNRLHDYGWTVKDAFEIREDVK